jgi:DegT/DnrJ/EryC1/StrS aminotransferase family
MVSAIDMTERLQQEIEAILRDRTGRSCIFLPSGRMALYLALVTWLSPGSRILMSPVNDDVVFFVVLAAGLSPIMAPISDRDGNIDLDAVPEQVWSRLSAVLTTNLYGLPDRVLELRERCSHLGIQLIEDAAHAIETEVDGRPIGTFGCVSAFSFGKHIGGVGGVLAFEDERYRPQLLQLRKRLIVEQTPLRSLFDRKIRPRILTAAEGPARRLLIALGLRGPARRVGRELGLIERPAYRMDLRATALRKALLTPRDLPRFDRWLRVDLHEYRTQVERTQLERTLAGLRGFKQDQARRIEGTQRLRQLPVVAPAAREGVAQPLFRVPLLVRDRDVVAGELRRNGIEVHYVYDPPLDDYAGPGFAEPSPAPQRARWWARHALPIDPLHAEPVLDVIRAMEATLEPPESTSLYGE